jgi:hypothetical protein
MYRSFDNKIMIKIKLVDMPTIFYPSKLYLSNCHGSWVVSIKRNMKLNFQSPSTFVLLLLKKTVISKFVYPLKVYQHTKLHSPTLAGASFSIHLRSPNVSHSWMVEAMGLKLQPRSHLQCHDHPTEFRKNLVIGTNVIGGIPTDGQTHQLVIS